MESSVIDVYRDKTKKLIEKQMQQWENKVTKTFAPNFTPVQLSTVNILIR